MSLLFAFVFFGCFWAGRGSNIYSEGDYALHFPKKGVSDYATITGMPSLTQYTVCFWMKSSDLQATPFSYAVSTAPYANELLIEAKKSNQFRLHIRNDKRDTGVSATDGKWHHICTSWSSSDGAWNIYKDGKLGNNGTGYKQGYTIKSGGVLVVGQDQDSVGGGFDSSQSLKGYLANLNVWSQVLSADTINEMFKSCLRGEGDVFKWSDFKQDVKGNTKVVIPSPCA